MALAELQTESVGKSVLDKPCFIILPMGQTSSPVRKRAEEVFQNYIEPVCKATGYFPVRSSPTLGGSIIKGITNALNCAPMTIAYLGGLPWNPNVMIEVGYRLNTKLPLVYLCDQDDSGDDLPLPFHFQGQWVVSLPVSGVDAGKIEALIELIRASEREPRHLEWLHPVALINVRNRDTTSEHNMLFTAASESAEELFGIDGRLVGPPLPRCYFC